MISTTSTQLFASFRSSFIDKYTFPQEAPMGEGTNAQVFLARDIHRGVDVAIKIFHSGITPPGAERGWRITSQIIDKQVAPTRTIESFLHMGSTYQAVVSRFVPGRSLKQVWEWYDQVNASDQALIVEDLSRTFIPSLLEVLEKCHALGYGHGDLHEGNIMIFLTDIRPINALSAILIDFDNSSLKTALQATTEEQRKAADVRLFNRRIGPYVTNDWRWGSYIAPIYRMYDNFKDIRSGYNASLAFIELIEAGTVTEQSIESHLKILVTLMLSGFDPKPIIDIMRNIATTAGHQGIFKTAYDRIVAKISDRNSWESSAEIIEINCNSHYLI